MVLPKDLHQLLIELKLKKFVDSIKVKFNEHGHPCYDDKGNPLFESDQDLFHWLENNLEFEDDWGTKWKR